MRALCTETPSGAMRQNSVSMVVLIEGTSKPILPRHPYMLLLLVKESKSIQPRNHTEGHGRIEQYRTPSVRFLIFPCVSV
jgi:hypothetical protein